MPSTHGRSITDHYESDSPVGTEFLRTYHILERSNDAKGGSRSYLITSATVGEGKSTVACYLALTLATVKKKTLLIDGDLRRPSVHKLFNLYLEDGVTEVADGGTTQNRAYKSTSVPTLQVLTAGRLTQNPSSYYESGAMARILETAKSQFDFVIVDCAPVMPVVDPIVIAREVTGVLMVVKAGVTHRDLVKDATKVLQKSNAPILGVVLNNVNGVLPYHYAYRYAYEYYKPTATADETASDPA